MRHTMNRELKKKLGQGNFHAIARKADINPAHVSRVLRGLRGASMDTAGRIAKAADVTVDELYAYIAAQRRTATAA